MNQLDALATQIKACSKCPLREGATQPVPGFGAEDAEYFLIGEAPGHEEDKAGMPFVGAAGKRLNRLIALSRDINPNKIYLSNCVRCRPPKNREPRKAELLACVPYLWEEIKLIKPSYLIALGRVPTALFSSQGIKNLHGTMITKRLVEYKDGSCGIVD